MNDFSREELIRYQRHLGLAGFGPEAQMKLKAASVLVIGAGGLGCPALLYLAAAGVGRITIVDDDRVDLSNLQRQILYAESDAGQPKAAAAARRLRALNPLISIVPVEERFSRANAMALVSSCDVVVDGSDNFSTRYLVNDACVIAGKPFVFGAVQGFDGQLSVFNWRGGPTYRCLFSEPPPPGTVPNCAEAGVLGVMPGLIGTAQACEAIKLLTGIGEPLSGRLLLWNALTMAVQTLAISADPKSREVRELPPEGYGEVCAAQNAGSTPGGEPGNDGAPLFGLHFRLGKEEEIDVAQLRAKIAAAEKFQLIDVREGWERALGSIEPSVHLPLSELNQGGSAATLQTLNPDAPTIVYCAAGARSLRAAKILREQNGFRSAVSLRGGFKDWTASAPK
jgi:adenylyltransferase/sulfurtransferase